MVYECKFVPGPHSDSIQQSIERRRIPSFWHLTRLTQLKDIFSTGALLSRAEKEFQRLNESMKALAGDSADIEAMRDKLKALRDRNLDEATFEEKLDLVSKLGIKVSPSEDLRSIRVFCQLDLGHLQSGKQSTKTESIKSQAKVECESDVECRKVLFSPPFRTKGKTFEKAFALAY